jgi:hypothetical protein
VGKGALFLCAKSPESPHFCRNFLHFLRIFLAKTIAFVERKSYNICVLVGRSGMLWKTMWKAWKTPFASAVKTAALLPKPVEQIDERRKGGNAACFLANIPAPWTRKAA